MTKPLGDFIWYELMTSDPAAAAGFYGAVVGWKIADHAHPDAGGMDYRMIVRDDGGNAGGVLGLSPDMVAHGARPVWLPYLHVADVDAAVAAIVAEGGAAMMPPMDLPVGRIAMVTDPQGASIYLMDPVPPTGMGSGESDVFSVDAVQRVNWNELLSSDLEGSKAFYAKHFGFEFNNSMPMGELGDYCFAERNGRQIGAAMQRMSPDQPPMWQFYFRVPSVSAAKRAVEAGGGTVTMDIHQVPGDDWIFNALDPQGAAFGVVGAKGD